MDNQEASSEAAPPVIENVGQLVDAVAIGKAGRVTVPRAQWPDLDGLILRCRKHYGTVPGDGALLRATAAVAEYQGTLLHRVNAMTLAEFNAALDEAFKAPEPPANSLLDSPPAGGNVVSPEARAILFIQDHLKKTGAVPTKVAIAKLLEVDRRTLNNWTAFKVAYAKLKQDLSKNRPRPKGAKSSDGTVEAWRD